MSLTAVVYKNKKSVLNTLEKITRKFTEPPILLLPDTKSPFLPMVITGTEKTGKRERKSWEQMQAFGLIKSSETWSVISKSTKNCGKKVGRSYVFGKATLKRNCMK